MHLQRVLGWQAIGAVVGLGPRCPLLLLLGVVAQSGARPYPPGRDAAIGGPSPSTSSCSSTVDCSGLLERGSAMLGRVLAD